MATPEAERRQESIAQHVRGLSEESAADELCLLAHQGAVAGREQLRTSAARAADTLERDVQAAAPGARQAG